MQTSLLKTFLFVVTSSMLGGLAMANTAMDNPLPLSHCYHWLQQSRGYMDFKYDYAAKNENELTFFTTPGTSNGSVAGPGLYCAKSPSGSFNYGDRIIRIEFVRDVVFLDAYTNKKYCGTDGKYYKTDEECQSKDWDVKYYNNANFWYVIQNPRAIYSWSATNNQIVRDLKADVPYANANYPAHIQNAMNLIQQDIAKNGDRSFLNARARMSFAQIVNNKQLLRSLPALAILAELANPEAKKIDSKVYNSVLGSTITRILQDQFLPWSEVKAAIDKDASFEKAFIAALKPQLEALASGKSKSQNLSTMVMIAGMKGSGVAPEQMQSLIEAMFKNPTNVIYARFSKEDLSASNKKIFEDIVTAKSQSPEVKKDLDTIVALMSFANGNALAQPVRAAVQDLFYEHIKSLGKSKYFLTDGVNQYPLADTAKKAVTLCQAHISAYQLFNKPLAIGTANMKYDIGEVPDVPSIQGLCSAQSDMFVAISNLKDGSGKVYVLEGTINNLPYKFIGTDKETLIPQLDAFMKVNNFAQYKSMTVAVNGSTSKKVGGDYTGFYSYGTPASKAGEYLMAAVKPMGITSKIEQKILDKITALGNGKATDIQVELKTSEPIFVTFKADTLEDLHTQCQQLAPLLKGKSFNTFKYSVGKYQNKTFNSGVYFDDVCNDIGKVMGKIALVKQSELPRFRKIAQLAQGKKTAITLKLAGLDVNMGADTIEDFDTQCALIGDKYNGVYDSYYYTMSTGARANVTQYFSAIPASNAELCGKYREYLVKFGLPSRLEAETLAEFARLSQNKKYKMAMDIGGLTFDMGANNVEEFKNLCVPYVKLFSNKPTPNIGTYTFTGKAAAVFRIDKTSAQANCDLITTMAIENGLPSAHLIKLTNQKSKYKYVFDLTDLKGTVFPIVSDDYESMGAKCVENFAKMGRTRIQGGSIKIDGKDNQIFTNWVQVDRLCKYLEIYLFGHIPSREQISINKITARSEVKVMIYSTIPLTFKVNSNEQLFGQCLNLFDSAPAMDLRQTSYSVDGGPVTRLAAVQSPREFCSMLSKTVKLKK